MKNMGNKERKLNSCDLRSIRWDAPLLIVATFERVLWLTTTTSCRGSVTEQRHFRVKANVVVGVFAHLTLVDTDQLRVFVDAEAHEGGEVHYPQDHRLIH